MVKFKAANFLIFIWKLETLLYLLNSSIRFGIVILGFEMKNNQLSAYGEALWFTFPTVTPVISICFLTDCKKGSRHSMNKIGERGHHYLVTFFISKVSEKTQFTFIWAWGNLYILEIQILIFSPNPISFIILYIKQQSTRSNTFSVSVERRPYSCLSLFILWFRSIARIVPSLASLSGIKPT